MSNSLSQLTLFELPSGKPEQTAPISLPFQRSQEIDVERARKILHVSVKTMRRILDKKVIRAYRLVGAGSKCNPWRIEYASLVEYCDQLRVDHGISPRSVGAMTLRGRRRDVDLLPFPIEETISVSDVAERLVCSEMTVLLLIESGTLVAYRLLNLPGGWPWRIHSLSLDRYLRNLNEQAAKRPTTTRRP